MRTHNNPVMRSWPSIGIALLLVASFSLPVSGAVRGIVKNASTGQPAAGVQLTLSSFLGGMEPLEETFSQPDGKFEFTKDLPGVPQQQPFLGAIRAEYDAVGYTEILRSGESLENVEITIYSTSSSNLPSPVNRILILEPGETEMIVQESYQFLNSSQPPVTYSTEEGTLRFYLPPAAQGIVQVSGTGPARMPLQSTALQEGNSDIYKVDFPLKPGENRIDLTYLLPRSDEDMLEIRSLYRGVPTRIAAPEGVSLSGESLENVGQEPSTRATIYGLPDTEMAKIGINGIGRLRSSTPEPSAPASQISIAPAPVASELTWIIILTTMILGVGFYHLATSSTSKPDESQPSNTANGPPAKDPRPVS